MKEEKEEGEGTGDNGNCKDFSMLRRYGGRLRDEEDMELERKTPIKEDDERMEAALWILMGLRYRMTVWKRRTASAV